MIRAGRSRLAALERSCADLESRAGKAEQEKRLLSEVISSLPVGVLVLADDRQVVLENRFLDSPAADAGLSVLVRNAAVTAASECLDSGSSVRRELDLHGPPRCVFELTAEPLTDRSILCLVSDVSERTRLAEIRRDFTINASHELRTPVGAIALLAETLQEEHDPTNIKTLAAHLVREAERAQALLDGVLDLARFEAEQRPHVATVDLAWVVRQALERLSPFAAEAGVELRSEAAERGVCVEGEAEQLVSAVTNLVDNAIKYSKSGSSVSVSVTNDGQWATVAVADEGIGIPSRDLDRIFERFYRVDRGRDRRTGGTGLGLSIVRHVADNHRGQINVESVEGQGSTFFLALPAAV